MKLGRKGIVSYLFTFCNYFYEICFERTFSYDKRTNEKSKNRQGRFRTCRFSGAGNEIRTRDIHLGKVTLYH